MIQLKTITRILTDGSRKVSKRRYKFKDLTELEWFRAELSKSETVKNVYFSYDNFDKDSILPQHCRICGEEMKINYISVSGVGNVQKFKCEKCNPTN